MCQGLGEWERQSESAKWQFSHGAVLAGLRNARRVSCYMDNSKKQSFQDLNSWTYLSQSVQRQWRWSGYGVLMGDVAWKTGGRGRVSRRRRRSKQSVFTRQGRDQTKHDALSSASKNAKGVIAAATPSSAMDDQDAAAAVMAAITTSVPDNATAVVVPKPVSEILRSSHTYV